MVGLPIAENTRGWISEGPGPISWRCGGWKDLIFLVEVDLLEGHRLVLHRGIGDEASASEPPVASIVCEIEQATRPSGATARRW